MHQLHAGTASEESQYHDHLQYPRMSAVALSVDSAQRANTAKRGNVVLSDNIAQNIALTPHVELISDPSNSKDLSAKSPLFDLCLDCPCHGGHLSLPLTPTLVADTKVAAEASDYLWVALPFYGQPNYRPPIV